MTDSPTSPPRLGIEGFTYPDLYDLARLGELAALFDSTLSKRDGELFAKFDTYRTTLLQGTVHGGLSAPDEANLLVSVARELGNFLVKLFPVESEAEALKRKIVCDEEVSRFKKEFVTKRVTKVQSPSTDEALLSRLDQATEALIRATLGHGPDGDREFSLALTMNRLTALERDYPRTAAASGELSPSTEPRAALGQILDAIRAGREAAALFDPAVILQRDNIASEVGSPESFRREAAALYSLIDQTVIWSAARWRRPSPDWNFSSWTSFRLPHPLHFDSLVPTVAAAIPPSVAVWGPEGTIRRRDGFALTDPRFDRREVSDEANYCIYCHERKKDSCSNGFVEKDGNYRVNPLGLPLQGCPLDERIGESNLLRSQGDSVAALAVVMIDNPMCPGTGHRICNDCMRSCIFQKQEPVNIPQIETGILTEVLELPWGFEIYSLLTRWNPIAVRRPVALPFNGKKVLVVGLGPAGYTLAHYLANEGFGVVAIDALKLEPLPSAWVGDESTPPLPIRDIKSIRDDLDSRVLAGFGGVSEYGITVRWDKNFLKCIRLALERRGNIRMYGAVRFGGTITVEDAFDLLGFDHIALAAGAGTPTIVRMKNNLIRGIRKASDFLMAIQLSGAFKKNSLANLQVQLPAIVVGGGLTAVDTATELFAYYPVQVEKIASRYETLTAELGEGAVRAAYDPEELSILDELLGHGAAVRAERERAAAAGEKPDFITLVRKWGGVTIAYRKGLTDSPAYRLNYEEVAKALEEGIGYAANLSPIEALNDASGHLRGILFERQIVEDGRWVDSGEIIELPARSLMVAAGTSPNVIYEKEHPGTFRLDKYGQFFQSNRFVRNGEGGRLEEVTTPGEKPGFFTSYRHPGSAEKLISFYGDNHPRYAGNVVKAMASAKDGYPIVVELFAPALESLDRSPAAQSDRSGQWQTFLHKLDDVLLPRVVAVNRLTSNIVEVIVRAPFAAERFKPGQFYRLQNFESTAIEIDGTKLVMEGLALTGAWTDPAAGLLSTIVLEMGGSSRLCATLKPGEPIVLMGPTGTPTDIPANEVVLLAGGGLGNAVLFSIARALRENGCKVIYFAGYKLASDLFKQDEIEAGTNQVIWSVDKGEPISGRRSQDLSFVGNIVQSMLSYATGEILDLPLNSSKKNQELESLSAVRRIIAIGSDGMMRAVKDARTTHLAPFLSPAHIAIGSINSPMQCMMKQVCAQCLQRHVDPVTGKESFVFSCFNQDQELDHVDFVNLRSRLRQNTVSEKLTNLWLTRLLAREPVATI